MFLPFASLIWSLLISAIFFNFGIIPTLIRRLHDLNINGEWIWLIPFFSTILSLYVRLKNINGVSFSAIILLTFLFTIFITMFLSVKKGVIGLNKYGPDPLDLENNQSQNNQNISYTS